MLPASLLMGFAVLLAGCGSEVSSSADTAGLTLDCPNVFQSTTAGVGVNRIFDLNIGGRTCSAGGCHLVGTSSGGAFKLYPNAAPNTPEMQANFYAAKAFVNLSSPTESKLLLEPLAGSQAIVGGHGGGDIFPDALDPNYVTILAWIANQIQGPSACYP